jgi:pimeloyl-ACP methyl ester carboxylesterase
MWDRRTVLPITSHDAANGRDAMKETLSIAGIGEVEIQYAEHGQGQPVLLLHGGAGPVSVAPWAERFAGGRPVRVLTPTHPGFMGTSRPEGLRTVGGLAQVYAALLEKLGLTGVTVVGNSIGGWVAAELALLAPARVGRVVLVSATGIEVPGHPVADVFSLTPAEISRLSYHDPKKFQFDPSKLPPQQLAMMQGNRATLKVYGGATSVDSTLRARLAKVAQPTLVVWGEADRIVDGAYGRAYAEAIPGARFQLLPGTGHVPQIETPELLADAVGRFVAA